MSSRLAQNAQMASGTARNPTKGQPLKSKKTASKEMAAKELTSTELTSARKFAQTQKNKATARTNEPNQPQTNEAAWQQPQQPQQQLKPDPIMTLRKVLGFSPISSNSVLWVNAGRCLAFPCRNLVVILTVADRGQVFLCGHTGNVNALATNGDGTLLASSQVEKQPLLRIWDVLTRDCLCILGYKHEIESLSFSYQGRILSVVGKDEHNKRRIKLWDTATAHRGRIHLITQSHSDADISVFKITSMDANRMVSCGRDNIRLWRIRQGILRSCAVNLSGFHNAATRFTDIGFRLSDGVDIIAYVACTSGDIFEINCTAVRLHAVHHVHDSPITSLFVSSSICVTGSEDKLLRVWPLTFSEAILEAEHDAAVAAVDVKHDGTVISVGTMDGNVGVLDVMSRKYSTLIRSHQKDIEAVALDPLRPHMASVSSDEHIRVWDLHTNRLICEFRAQGDVPRSVVYRQAHHEIAVGFQLGHVRVFDVETTQMVCGLRQHSGAVTNVIYAVGGERLYSAGEDGMLVLYDVLQGYLPLRIVSFIEPGPAVIALNSLGTYLAYNGPTRKSVSIADSVTLEEIAQMDIGFRDRKSKVSCMIFCDTRPELIVGSSCGRVVIINTADGMLLRQIGSAHKGGVSCLTSMGDYFATGGADCNVKVWDLLLKCSPKHQNFVGHSSGIKCIQFRKHSTGKTPATEDAGGPADLISAGDALFIWDFKGKSKPPASAGNAAQPLKLSSFAAGYDATQSSLRADTAAAQNTRHTTNLREVTASPLRSHALASDMPLPPDHNHGQHVPDLALHREDPTPLPAPTRMSTISNARFGNEPQQPGATPTTHTLGGERSAFTAGSEKTFSVVSQDVNSDHSIMATGTITDGGSANSDVVPTPDAPLENAPPTHHMEKPSSLAHYVSRSGVPALAKQRYVAARKQAGLEMVTTFGYAYRGRKNMHWHPQTGVFVYSSG